MGQAAVKAAQAIGYSNAGTIEFLVANSRILLYGDEYPLAGRTSRYRND
jgi:acetyl/propionyl-CoA carboxylase alpha subunit